MSKDKTINRKRAALLSQARALFYKHGIKRVTVEEICRDAGISKMTFYKHFQDKNNLARQVLLDMIEDVEKRYEAIRKADVPFVEKLKALIPLKVEQSEALGWDYLKDITSGAFPELSALLRSRQEKNTRIFVQDIAAAQARGDVRPNLNAESLLFIIDEMKDWVKDERLLRRFGSVKALTEAFMDFFIYGLVGRPDTDRRRP
ncbi:MAG: TetR/AcrR family transcriptional regulator [Candidatus Aminicenantes bacterium]|nr:TetR/AcrR family transcriptional regulator [Candidatus Aminicenantes bacterium]